MKTHILRGFGILGILLFLPLFLFTFADPQLVEKSGRSFIEWRVKQEVFDKIDSVNLPKSSSLERILGERATALRSEAEKKLEYYKQQLKSDAPAIIAENIAKTRNLDCECRQKWEERLTQSLLSRIESVEEAKSNLVQFTQTKYMEVMHNLTLDVRIFLGTNSLVFILFFLASFFKPRAINHLFLPSSLLFISTTACSYFYLFEQNWLYTILYGTYTGLGFLAYLLIIFAILCDIVFNKAKISTEIINGLLSAIGNARALVPC
ncbi:hypothetical protein [Bacterioplanoides sp.]|uniref:hypothetical protein n=1 Tax=Bacterioplanoides sp. TaxID=2066072 RepID=UPI003B00D2AC